MWEGIELRTYAQWYFDSLVDSKENDPVRRVIHKWSLYREMEKKRNQGAINESRHQAYTKRCKDNILQALPLFQALGSVQQQVQRNLLNTYLR